MIQITSTVINVSLRGSSVYLDNWAFIELAKGDSTRRDRFIGAVRSGIDLLFSPTNAAELAGPRGRSADLVCDFIDEIGPCWYPVRLDATEAVKLELKGENPQKVCTDEEFFKYCIADQIRNPAAGAKVTNVSDDLFKLGPVIRRLAGGRQNIVQDSAKFDAVIKEKMSQFRERGKRDPSFLTRLKTGPFNLARRVSFVYFNLLEQLVADAHSIEKNDGMDFCHAVMSIAFSTFATLDKRWAQRIKRLPPNILARIYEPGELDQLVNDMEYSVRNRAA